MPTASFELREWTKEEVVLLHSPLVQTDIEGLNLR